MIYRCGDSELTAELLERRWFAAARAVESLQTECEVLLGVRELAEAELRRARAQLVKMETLRAALEEQLAAPDGAQVEFHANDLPRTVMSAA